MYEEAGAEHAPTADPSAAPAATGEHTGSTEQSTGGLPQFDVATWPGQIAWFLILFVLVFVVMKKVIVPRIGGAIDGRDAKIESDIAEARRMKTEADAAAAAGAAELAQGRANAHKVATDARAKSQAELAARLGEEEAKLAQTTAAAEARIAKARASAMTNVAQIGAETAAVIVERLTGSAATAAELKSAVGNA